MNELREISEFFEKYNVSNHVDLHRLYLDGELTANDTRTFEALFLSPSTLSTVRVLLIDEKLNKLMDMVDAVLTGRKKG